ncbi:dehydrogenase/reductase SDR family member 11-like [Pollicipes pollicipes]|nr:dehydrogenase/reductase SDR family member 11-like [Pollicipes pollicipes]
MAAELQGCAGSLTAMRCDLSQLDQVDAMFRTIEQQFGGEDVLINNADLNFGRWLLDGSAEKWRAMLDVNVLALAHCAQLAVNNMAACEVSEAQVINICSRAGHCVDDWPDLHFCTATKYAVTALTESLRQEVAAKKMRIRVAQISPGLVNTDIANRMLADKQEA